YPWDFLVIIIVALIFYQLGAISSFESVYFRRAKKMNSNMGDKLKKRKRREKREKIAEKRQEQQDKEEKRQNKEE
ncbi:TPA: amino acid:proton symporter, partial [Pseudomonas aeruginosa]|nr:amino acid:proton symporter [Pseudomonas aeruginosa]